MLHQAKYLIDHALNLAALDPNEWKLQMLLGGSWYSPGAVSPMNLGRGSWLIYRNANRYWLKVRPNGRLAHLQSVGQIWDLMIDYGEDPTNAGLLVEDTGRWKADRANAQPPPSRGPASTGEIIDEMRRLFQGLTLSVQGCVERLNFRMEKIEDKVG